ncbi:DMT family transporter [Microbacterium sp. p3-SID338]|uniref:DMT family transporter n=1 Tax=unclassified Microbacterium TaxID=2609290 RepID=UPI000788B317|nr:MULTISPECIES: DMT family transporter [unclassified Microbacterium]KYJ98943.1 multidrug DMT transporter permease [Microbacterium sp. CH1]MCT1394977.1 DMT family transporter [Microbacterium sp. p3-SID338]PMC02313.1 multidrug DMT transporter permease [Microbacterium sp. UMB0228]
MGTVEDVGDQLVGAFQNPGLLLGIPLALAGAVFMSLGAQYQHRGVEKVERLSGSDGAAGLSLDQLKRLFTRPSWVIGTLMLGLAIVCQLAALVKAPLIVVQPLGAIALVITTLLNARISGHAPTRQSLTAIIACVGGIFLFVFFAAIYATEKEVTDRELFVILAILLVVIIVLGACWLILRHRMRALFYIIGAGILYGFVATLAKVIIKRIEAGQFEWITAVCLLALLSAGAVGAYFVQTAYSSGPPDLVIAGLTVVDPMVAVLIGMLVLGEAAAAPWWVFIIFGVAGGIAVWGVVGLARFHPQVLSESQDLGITRGSDPVAPPTPPAPSAPERPDTPERRDPDGQ